MMTIFKRDAGRTKRSGARHTTLIGKWLKARDDLLLPPGVDDFHISLYMDLYENPKSYLEFKI